VTYLKVIFTPLAERNIDVLHAYISAHASEERADGYVNRIIEFCNGFVTFPLRGTQRDDILRGLRVTGFERRATIAFVVTADAVLIEGIFYGGQDFEAILRDQK
jgi:toxin ParE1/3/4